MLKTRVITAIVLLAVLLPALFAAPIISTVSPANGHGDAANSAGSRTASSTTAVMTRVFNMEGPQAADVSLTPPKRRSRSWKAAMAASSSRSPNSGHRQSENTNSV